MKATELKTGQKYTWKRNSSTTHEVTYIGVDPHTTSFTGYEFSYEKTAGVTYVTLSAHQVDSDIDYIATLSLNKSESALLLAVITGNFSAISDSTRMDEAKKSLISKGFLRINEHYIIELNLSQKYKEQTGY